MDDDDDNYICFGVRGGFSPMVLVVVEIGEGAKGESRGVLRERERDRESSVTIDTYKTRYKHRASLPASDQRHRLTVYFLNRLKHPHAIPRCLTYPERII